MIGLSKKDIMKLGVGLEYSVLERVAAIIEANNTAVEKQLSKVIKQDNSAAK